MVQVNQTLAQLRANRLATRVAELKQLVAFQVARKTAKSIGLQQVELSLQAAEKAQQEHNEQEGWAHCNQAFRFLLWSLEPPEALEPHRRALRREAEEKLSRWRKEAVLDLLGRDAEKKEPVQADALCLAQYLFDQHFDNVYFKLDAVAIRIRSLRWALLFLTAVVLGLSYVLPQSASNSVLFHFQHTGLVLLAGALGAALSNALSVIGAGGKIPALLGEYASWFVRLPLGALSAVALVAVLQSELLPVTMATDLAMYAWAIVGGFSDQLLNKVITKVESAIDK